MREGKPSELRYTLARSSVPKGTVVFTVVDKGKLGHDFKVCSKPQSGSANSCKGKATPMIMPGMSATLSIVFAKAGIARVPLHGRRTCRPHEGSA